jgi:hypothetical protein
MSEELQRLINQKLEAKVASDIELQDRAQNRKQTWEDLPGAWEKLKWHIQQIVASSGGVLKSRINPKTGDLKVTNTVDEIVLTLESSVTGANLYAFCRERGHALGGTSDWSLFLSWHLCDGVLLLAPGHEWAGILPEHRLTSVQVAEALMRRLLSPTTTIVTKVTDEFFNSLTG